MDLLSQKDKLPKTTSSIESWRQKGAQAFVDLGLPTRKDEDWKYTSVKALTDHSYTSALTLEAHPSHETMAQVGRLLSPDFTNIVFINGRMDKTLSGLEDLESGVTCTENLNFVDKNFADSFDALNACYAGQGVEITIADGVSIEKPLQLFFYTALEGGPALMTHPKIIIRVGQKSSVKIIESYFGQVGARYLVNAVTEIFPGQDSKTTYIRLQNESEQAFHIGRTNIMGSHCGHVQSLVLSIGAQLSRHNLLLELKAKNIFAEILGIYAIAKSQHVDNHTQMNHHVGECHSAQLYKGILSDESRGVFNGKVYIHQDAQKANSEQLNSNLLLSSKAEVDAKPQLEIYADDVKASHGATIGQLNKEELFYLMSRGISKEKSIPMLSYGFLSGVIDRLESAEIEKYLKNILQEKFYQMNAETQ